MRQRYMLKRDTGESRQKLGTPRLPGCGGKWPTCNPCATTSRATVTGCVRRSRRGTSADSMSTASAIGVVVTATNDAPFSASL